MKLILLYFILSCSIALGQITETISVNEKLNANNREMAQKELIFHATMKLIETKASEFGLSYPALNTKLSESFNEYFTDYKERKLREKFGTNYHESLKAEEKSSFLKEISKEEKSLLINFSNVLSVVEKYHFKELIQDKIDLSLWSANLELVVDKSKLEKFFHRTLNKEKKALSKVFIITEIMPFQFTWTDLGLENEVSFTHPLNKYWLKWFDENMPSNIESVILCSSDCLLFYNKWIDSQSYELSTPEEFYNSAFLKITLNVTKSNRPGPIKEDIFKWEGRTVLQDIQTKRVLANWTIYPESRTLISQTQKAINSALASSISRSPLPMFMELDKRISERKSDLTRSKKLVLSGYKNSGDVFSYVKLLKDRGNSLGLDISIDAFSKDQTTLRCFHKGEEKSFTDLLSGIKELKSYNNYTLVNDFTGAQLIIKFVAE